MENTNKVYFASEKPAGFILPGKDVIVTEKGYNEILHIEICSKDYSEMVNYKFYSKKNFDLLVKVARILVKGQENFTVADYFELINALWIVYHKSTERESSKLDCLQSISSCCLDNNFCYARMNDEKKGRVCKYCYAAAQQKRHFTLTEHNIINGLILRNVLFPDLYASLVPVYTLYARIESFGDVANVTQARNYTRIIKTHPMTNFGIWSKNFGTWYFAFMEEETGKPENCTFVTSSEFLNKEDSFMYESHKKFIDHVFTVYEKSADVEINCGGRRCMDCIMNKKGCYFKPSEKNPVSIKEELK